MKKQDFSSTVKSALQTFRKKFPILFNIALIVVVLTLIGTIAFYSMGIGTRHNSRRSVPTFVGMSFAEAEQLASKHDLKVVVNDSIFIAEYPGGAVLDQLPKEGAVVKPGRKVYVTLNSFRQRMVDVPYVAGRSLRHATNMLEAAGLAIKRIEYGRDLATNYVLAQYLGDTKVLVDSKLKAEKGTGLILQVGVAANARPLIVPPVIGRNLSEAKSRLWESGLNIGRVVYDDGIPAIDRARAKVYSQSAKPGKSTSYGASVSLYLTLDTKKIQDALNGHDVKALEAKLEADSLAEAALQHLTDSLAKLNASEPQSKSEPAPAPATDSLATKSADSSH